MKSLVLSIAVAAPYATAVAAEQQSTDADWTTAFAETGCTQPARGLVERLSAAGGFVDQDETSGKALLEAAVEEGVVSLWANGTMATLTVPPCAS